MFMTRPHSQAEVLADDLAAIARIEASLSRVKRTSNARGGRDFSRLRPYLPDLEV